MDIGVVEEDKAHDNHHMVYDNIGDSEKIVENSCLID